MSAGRVPDGPVTRALVDLCHGYVAAPGHGCTDRRRPSATRVWPPRRGCWRWRWCGRPAGSCRRHPRAGQAPPACPAGRWATASPTSSWPRRSSPAGRRPHGRRRRRRTVRSPDRRVARPVRLCGEGTGRRVVGAGIWALAHPGGLAEVMPCSPRVATPGVGAAAAGCSACATGAPACRRTGSADSRLGARLPGARARPRTGTVPMGTSSPDIRRHSRASGSPCVQRRCWQVHDEGPLLAGQRSLRRRRAQALLPRRRRHPPGQGVLRRLPGVGRLPRLRARRGPRRVGRPEPGRAGPAAPPPAAAGGRPRPIRPTRPTSAGCWRSAWPPSASARSPGSRSRS